MKSCEHILTSLSHGSVAGQNLTSMDWGPRLHMVDFLSSTWEQHRQCQNRRWRRINKRFPLLLAAGRIVHVFVLLCVCACFLNYFLAGLLKTSWADFDKTRWGNPFICVAVGRSRHLKKRSVNVLDRTYFHIFVNKKNKHQSQWKIRSIKM